MNWCLDGIVIALQPLKFLPSFLQTAAGKRCFGQTFTQLPLLSIDTCITFKLTLHLTLIKKHAYTIFHSFKER